MNEIRDKIIICADCRQEFVWTVGEQEYYAQNGLESPKYCMICRGKYKAMQRDPGARAKYQKNN